MKGQARIDEMWAWIIVDEDNTEGIPAQRGPDGSWMPMVGADADRIKSLRPYVKKVVDLSQRAAELVRFTERTSFGHLRPSKPSGRVTPKKSGPQISAERAVAQAAPFKNKPGAEVPYRTFDEPQLGEGFVMDNIMVAATLVDGQPGISLIFMKDGKPLPALTLVGDNAENLAELAKAALAGAKQQLN